MAESLDKDSGSAPEERTLCEGGEAKRPPVLAFLLKGLSQMTVREQQAVLIVLLLCLLGIGVKLWHSWQGPDTGAAPVHSKSFKSQ